MALLMLPTNDVKATYASAERFTSFARRTNAQFAPRDRECAGPFALCGNGDRAAGTLRFEACLYSGGWRSNSVEHGVRSSIWIIFFVTLELTISLGQ